ncbi:hypothetical protein BLNAU_24224 [Blattamonas nauphoetae]|uniref:Uncharacterized protein n=1 Tax=Blattamonas nauphoetae TaxID=2049346 RepID=A0ABQ9WQV4_9EUKA|nr:hypothetical protein BLNAU_24224 [Blattamonas nauphoetae]
MQALTIRDGRYGLDNHQLQLFQLLGRFRSKANHIDSTLFVSNERICLFVTIICEDFVVDVKEAIEEKPAAEEESRQMKQAVVQSVSMSVATLSRLLSTSHEAALSITSCDTLALSGLLFENCAGQSASSLFIDSSSSVSLATPIASSFSVCSSPRSSVNGDISTVFLPHAASITIDPEDGTDEQFCWSTSVGCQSLSGIVDRLMPTFEYKLNVAEGTTSESTLSITSKKTITVTGLGSARSLMVMQSTAQSFAHLSDGSLARLSWIHRNSFTDWSISPEVVLRCEGGSLRPESVEFIPLSFSGTSSFVKMSGASTLSLKRVSFVSMKNEASGDVVMKSVSIFTAGMTGSRLPQFRVGFLE